MSPGQAAGSLDYRIVDVFTKAPFAGNPLAVVLAGDLLTTAQCQALAREFNLSETAFPMAPSAAGSAGGADYRLRIFTPASELPFAGHPSLGAAWVQREIGAVAGAGIVQECGVGLLPLSFAPDGSIELTGGPPTVGEPLAADLVAGLLAGSGLSLGDLAHGDLAGRARTASTGAVYAVVPVTEQALLRATPGAGLTAALRPVGDHGLLLLAWAAGSAHVRMFAPGQGVPEDPATGSAATALGAYLAAEGLIAAEGWTTVEILQGAEMGRPSQLRASVEVRGGVAVACRVAGHVVPVGSGTVLVPPG